MKLEELREEVLNLLGVAVEDEEEPKEAEDPFADHPLVRQYRMLVAEYQVQRNEFAARGDFEKATAAIELRDVTSRQLRSLLNKLRDDPTYGLPSSGAVARFGRELPWQLFPCMRAGLAGDTVKALLENRPVLLVGRRGAGRRTLAGFCAKRLFEETCRSRIVPRRVIEVDHAALAATEGGTEAALLAALDVILNGADFIPAIAEGHLLVNPRIPIPAADTWTYFFKECLDHRVPLLIWTVPTGEQLLRTSLPGLVDASTVLHLDDPPEADVLAVTRQRMHVLEREQNVQFEAGFMEALSVAIRALPADGDWAQPGRALELLEGVVTHAARQQVDLAVPNRSPAQMEVERLSIAAQGLIAVAEYATAMPILKKILNLQKKQAIPIPAQRKMLLGVSSVTDYLNTRGAFDQVT
jgi:hypothetical protein